MSQNFGCPSRIDQRERTLLECLMRLIALKRLAEEGVTKLSPHRNYPQLRPLPPCPLGVLFQFNGNRRIL